MLGGRPGAERARHALLERAELAYTALRELGGQATIDEVASASGLKRLDAYYALTKLAEAGFATRERGDDLRLYFKLVRSFNREELLGHKVYVPPGELEIYARARAIMAIIAREGVEADLIGSCKIHIGTYPHHDRITVDVDVVAFSEAEAERLAQILGREMGLRWDWAWTIIKQPFNDMEGGVDIMPGGIKKNPLTYIWMLSHHLKDHSMLTLEHAVVGKLSKSTIDPTTDAYDAYKGLVYSDLEVLARLTHDVFTSSPEHAENMPRNLNTLLKSRELIKEHGLSVESDWDTLEKLIAEYKKLTVKKHAATRHLFKDVKQEA